MGICYVSLLSLGTSVRRNSEEQKLLLVPQGLCPVNNIDLNQVLLHIKVKNMIKTLLWREVHGIMKETI